ncbi:MAG: hypothetical protein ACYCOR_00870 [Acidobacteriaceae bacterium]
MIFLRSSAFSVSRYPHAHRPLPVVGTRARFSTFLGIGLLCLSIGMGPSAMAQSAAQASTSAASGLQGFAPAPLDSGFGPLNTAQPRDITAQQIVQRFAAKETQFKRALENYTYRRTVKLDSIDDNGGIDGEYLQVDDIVLSPSGHKQERVVYAPDNTLTRALLSPADFDDIEHRLPFTLTTEDVAQYRVTYIGMERVDQVGTYVFDVTPRHMEKDRRYFSGRIWVDAKDFQIVVTSGKNIPDDTRRGQEDLSIPFTTYRQQIDGKYWFPVYTRAEGMLHFQNCKACLPSDVHLREIVKYGDYKRFGSTIRFTYEGLERPTGVPSSLPVSGPSDGSQTAGAASATGTLAESQPAQPTAAKD